MNPYQEADHWTARLPERWVGSRDGDTSVLVDPGGTGVVQITEVRATEPIPDFKLRAMAEDDRQPESVEVTEERWGDFAGFGVRRVKQGSFITQLYLCRERDLVYVTYVCDQGDEHLEADAVRSILDSLRWKGE